MIKDQGERQLDAIKNQGEKQLDVIEKQNKMLLLDGKFHEFNFLKKYGDLYSLLEDLVTKKKRL